MQHKQSIYYVGSSLYMFRVSTIPVIRSTENVTTASVLIIFFVQLPPSNMAKLTLHVSGVNHTRHQEYTKM